MTSIQVAPRAGLDDAGTTDQRAPGALRLRRRRLPSPGKIVAWAVMLAALAVTLFPFWWVLRTGLSTTQALPTNSGSLLPADFTWDAFRRVLGLTSTQESLEQGGSGATVHFWLYLRNSLVVATLITCGQVFFSAMAAYAFARLRWPGRDAVFFVFITALMVPPIFTILPNFVLIKELGLLNTYAGVVAPYFFMTPFAVFFLRQFFLGISREVEEAAIIDGAGHFRIFGRVLLPMLSAPLATLGILTYLHSWSEYLWPLLAGQEEDVRVLTVALALFRSQEPQGSPDWAGLMAATTLAALPVLVLLMVFGRRVINSIQFSGIK